jgi:hypothetical protein
MVYDIPVRAQRHFYLMSRWAQQLFQVSAMALWRSHQHFERVAGVNRKPCDSGVLTFLLVGLPQFGLSP